MANKYLLTVLRTLNEGEKVSPQAKVILDTLTESGATETAVDREDLVAKLTESGALNTRQDPARVVAYYLPRLKEAGLVEVDVQKPEPTAVAEGEEKPKKARKSKAAATDGPSEVGADAAPEADAAGTEVAV